MVNQKTKKIEEEWMENLAMYHAFKHQRANIPLLKEAVYDLCHMLTQKTAGQRKDRPKDITVEALPRIKMTIIVEAAALVLSGALDGLEAEQDG